MLFKLWQVNSSQIMIFLCRFGEETKLQHLLNLICQRFLYMHPESLNGLIDLDQWLRASRTLQFTIN